MPWSSDDTLQASQGSVNQRNYSSTNSDHEVLTFQLLGQLLCLPNCFLLLLLEFPDGLVQLAELRILLFKHNSCQQQYDCSTMQSKITDMPHLFSARRCFRAARTSALAAWTCPATARMRSPTARTEPPFGIPDPALETRQGPTCAGPSGRFFVTPRVF